MGFKINFKKLILNSNIISFVTMESYLPMILVGYDILGYAHTPTHLKKLREKIGDPSIQSQLKTCTDAYTRYTKSLDDYHTHTDNEDMDLYGQLNQAHWRVYASMANLVALIDKRDNTRSKL